MTRIAGNAPVQVSPRNDMLTALLGAAIVAEVIALIVIFVRAGNVLGGLF